MPTPASLRPRLATVLALLALTVSLPAADFQGADAILRRLAESADAPAVTPADNQLAQLKAQLAAYRRDAATLPPEAAASRWLALFDSLARLPEDHTGGRSPEDRVDLAALLSVLPPPAAWDALAGAIETRTAKAAAPRELSLRLLGTVLTGDVAAQTAAVERLRAAIKADKKLEGYELESLLEGVDQAATAIAASAGDSAQLAAFERELSKQENAGSARSHYGSGYLNVPDLVRFGGRAAADPLLLRVLRLEAQLQLWGAGEHTRRALSELALKHIDQLKRPHWELVASLDDVALYEALSKKFPAKNAASEDERRSATLVYLLGLVASGRTADATALVFAPDTRFGRDGLGFGHGYGSHDVLGQLQRAGRGDSVVDFLRDVLARDPSLPFWDGFITISAQQSRAKEALAFLRATLAKPDLPASEAAALRTRYATALLAADEVDEGLTVLRALVAEDRRAAAVPPEAPAAGATITGNAPAAVAGLQALGVDLPPDVLAALQSGQAAVDFEGDVDLSGADEKSAARVTRIVTLLKLGRLLAKPELVDEGLAAGRDLLPRLGQSDAYPRSLLVGAMVDAFTRTDRAADAESVLADHIARLLKEEKGPYRSHQTQPALLQLAALYGHAGRHADVLRLLTGSPDLGVPDLDELPVQVGSDAGSSVHILVADALIAANRADEAGRILRRVVQSQPGRDAAYERLEKIGGPAYAAFLDEAARLDRYEERPLIWKARLQLASGDIAAAEQTIRAAIAIDPSDGEQGKGDRLRAYAVLGDVLERKGDADQAAVMRGAVAAIRLSEEADDWWSAGLLTRAVRLYEKSLLHFADAYCIQSRLALRYNELGDFAKAEEHYRRAFELMPDSFGRVESHCFGCEGAFNGTRAQNIADKVFTRLAAEPSARAQVFYLLGYLRTAQERFDEAAQNFRQAVARDPDYLNAWEKLLGLAGAVHLPETERETAALALLRLDPQSKRTNVDFSAVSNLRKLWSALLAAEATLPPKETGPLFAFPASKAKLDAAGKEQNEFAHFRRSFRHEEPEVRAQLGRHAVLSSTARLIEQTLRR